MSIVAIALGLSGVGDKVAMAITGFLQGDFNRDGHVGVADGDAMSGALADTNGYVSANGLTASDLLAIGDLNGDGNFNSQDINAFRSYLANGGGSTPGETPPTLHTSSQPGMLYFSTSATNPGATSPTAAAATNPHVTIAQGASTTLYIWAQVNDLELFNGLSLGVHSTQGSVATATGSAIFNPSSGSGPSTTFRWAATNIGILGSAGSSNLLSNAEAFFVTKTYFGLDGGASAATNGTYVPQAPADGSGETTVGSLLVGSLTLQGNNLGSTDLFLNSGNYGISYQDLVGAPVHFGADVTVNAMNGGVSSQLADATITVVPEPSTCCLLCLGAGSLLMAGRRTKSQGFGGSFCR